MDLMIAALMDEVMDDVDLNKLMKWMNKNDWMIWMIGMI